MITDEERELLSLSGYRVRSWEGQKKGLRRDVKLLADALRDPSEQFRALGRVGVSLSRWQLLQVKFWVWLNKPVRAQRIILSMMSREFCDNENE